MHGSSELVSVAKRQKGRSQLPGPEHLEYAKSSFSIGIDIFSPDKFWDSIRLYSCATK